MVAAAPPHGLVIDITGRAHLFGGEASLVADVLTRLHRLGFTASHALAATPAAAMALARFGQTRLVDLPLAALSDQEPVQIALRRAGLKCVGEVAKLPRAAVAARFGEALLAALDALTEAAPQPLDPRLPVAEIVAQQRFAQPIATTDAVRATLEKLLLRCAVQMGARGVGGRLFALALYRADGYVAHVAVEAAEPQRDSAVLLRLFDERIAALNDPLDPGFGYDLVRLAVPVTAGWSGPTRTSPNRRVSICRWQAARLRSGSPPPPASRRPAPSGCSIRHSRSRCWPKCPMARRAASAGAARSTMSPRMKAPNASLRNGGAARTVRA
jgi:protein ImuB